MLAVGEAVAEDMRWGHGSYDCRFDPHVGRDPKLWETVVFAVRDALIATEPAGAATYTSNAKAHIAEIKKLTAYMASVTATVPEKSRVLLTAHDAFS
mgnify:CR=1 FL=1